MFKPKYDINARLLENLKKIAALTQELNDRRFPKIVYAEMERDARALSAFSSTSIEGNPLPLSEVKKILKNTPAHIRDSEKEVLNYNRALEYLELNYMKKTGHIDSDLICTIQRMVTEGLIASHRSGRLRDEPVFVNDPRTGKMVYLPPDHKDVPILMEELVSFTARSIGQKIDPIITAGIFHKQLVTIHPFVDGNGRTARLATKVLLARMGLNTFNLFSFENQYNKNVGVYFAKVGLAGNYYDLVGADTRNTTDITNATDAVALDFTPWLEYFSEGIVDELLRVKKELANAQKSPHLHLRKEHADIIKFIESNGTITDKQYSTMTSRAKATRALDWKHLLSLGLIERKGKGKNTWYQFPK